MAEERRQIPKLAIHPSPSLEGGAAKDRQALAPFDHVIQGYERSLFLDHFLEAGRVPKVSHVEVAVCFADLRGFTKFVEHLEGKPDASRVVELLVSYFRIYPKAILEMVYALEPRGSAKITADDDQVRKSIVPSTYKPLGDGMMLVWELPTTSDLQDEVSARILQVVVTIQRRFRNLTSEQAEAAGSEYASAVKNLSLGFGLARGWAWRFDFGARRPVDYAGSVINVASRLQDLARPEGYIAYSGFCNPVLKSKESKARLTRIQVKGIDQRVEIWASPEVELKSLRRTASANRSVAQP